MNTQTSRKEESENPVPLLQLAAGVLSGLIAAFILILGYTTRRKERLPSNMPAEHSQSVMIENATSASQKQYIGRQDLALNEPSGTLWPTTTKYIMGIVLFLLVLLVLYLARSVIPLVILGSLVAFVVQPIIRFFRERLRMRRGLAIFTTYFLAFLIILLLPLILIPSIINVVDLISGIDFQQLAQDIAIWFTELIARAGQIPLIGSLIESLFAPLVESLDNFTANQPIEALDLDIAYDELITRLASTLGVLVRAVGAVASAVVAVFFSLFISIYLSFDAHKMKNVIPRLLPPAYKEEIEALFGRLGAIWEGFVRGQITLMVFIGFAVWLGATILGLPQPIFFGFLSGMLEMIPSLGPLLAFIPAVSVAWIFGSTNFEINNFTFALIVAGFYLLVQFLENQFIVPRVLGHAVDLHPLIVLVGALAAGSQFGLLGIFLAAPVIASFREIFEYIYSKILENPPEPPPEEKKSFWQDLRAFPRAAADNLRHAFRRFML